MPPEPSPRSAVHAPLLVDAATAAELCGISRSSWDRLTSRAANPRPVRLGGSIRWRVSDLQLWTTHRCPARAEFESLLNQ